MNDSFSIADISPYDEAFPVMLLSDAFNAQLDRAEKVAMHICDDVAKKSSEYFNVGKLEEDKVRIVVDATDDTLKDIHEGRIKLVEENGKLFAQIRENGRYSSKLPVKEEVYNEGWDSGQIAIAMHLKAIQDSLITVSKQLKTIDERVREVINGQQNDRLGIYYSGVALYSESTCVSDLEMKKNLVAQSIRALTDTIFQMTLIMQSDIRYLKNKEYESEKKKRAELIKEKMNNITQCFSVVHQASILKAGIYCKQGEVLATSAVLEEYSRFINGTVSSNAALLAQCDIADTGTEHGIWKSRAKLEFDVSKFAKQLKSSEKAVYIDTNDGGILDESN